jgi:hypothetical protein
MVIEVSPVVGPEIVLIPVVVDTDHYDHGIVGIGVGCLYAPATHLLSANDA